MLVAYHSTCRPTVGQQLSVDISTDISADISVDMSVNMSTDTSRPIYRLNAGRHIGRASVDMLTDTRPICRSTCRLIYQSRGAQTTHDPFCVGVKTDF